ncbi:MAG: recombinase RecA [Candidatus Rokuibacteriota bacterium]|nr:MAG: recombinase RecA [Candidatus Rokubacteria bacterium]
MTDHASTLKRLSTGSTALDAILGGGIPAGSVTVVAGEPGSGKTVFTLQALFHHARQGKKCLYFTTLSEPPLKVIRYMQLFSFFDSHLIEDRIVFADLGSTLRRGGVEQALARMIERVESEEPDIVAIDSFKAIHDLLPSAAHSRTFVYDLSAGIAAWGATTLLVGEYRPEDIGVAPEFAIADGIVRLTTERQELTTARQLEILKMRGANYVTGRHFFEMGADGLTFYPRVRGPELNGEPPVDLEDRVATGIAGLDALLFGGLPRASATMVEGGTGTGKTLVGLHFLLEGARRGEPGILFTLEETPAQIRAVAKNFGWDVAPLEAQGRLLINYTSPVELFTDRFLDVARRQIDRVGARHAVLDSLTSMALSVPSQRRFRELVYALTKHFRAAGVTPLMTMEVAELLGAAQLTGHGVSSTADNLILLRYVEVDGRLERAVSVLKARGTGHITELRRFLIAGDGAHVGERFRDLRGVLTGIPQPEGAGGRLVARRSPAKKTRGR